MKSLTELLSELKRLDIKIWAEGDYLGFDAPKGKLSSVLRSQLVERKQEILAFLRQVNLKIKSIQPVSRNEEIPLSFAQQRLWFLNQWEGENASYNESVAVQLKGLLNLSALQHSFNEIVRRHEILRTTFVCIDGKPAQVISPDLSLSLSIVDLQEIPQWNQRQAEALRLLAQAANCPFQLTKAPLLRTTLVKLDEKEHILLFTIHHIICDGWSMGILLQELAELYTAFCNNKPLPLPELLIQYADFAVWQRQWLTGDRLQSQLNYWQQQLINYPPILQLPTDRPRPVLQSFCGKTQSFSLSSDLTEALKALSRQEEVTLFMMLLAAFVTLLYRYSQQDDIVIGTAIANRNYKEQERLIGLFANTLVLRTNCTGNPTFRELLHQVRECTLSAYAHQDLPFEYLVEQLQPERNPSYNPLFQVMFVLQNSPMEELKLADLDLNLLPLENQTAKFDLSLVIQEKECGLYGELEYNTDLFNADTICRMVEHLQILLTGIVTNPEQRLGDLPILSAVEQQQLLVKWNCTQVDYPQDICIHQLFEAQVEQTPNAVAVVFADRQLTYQELNQQADVLAHYLKQLGVKPEVIVGICLEKSLEMVIGILAILKAGGVYLPLDPSYPRERLAFMLEDTKPLVLLAQTRLITELSLHQVKVVCLDTSWQDNISETITQQYITKVKSENLAYIIYTSGSTGTPKGVMIAHQALVNHSLTAAKIYKLQSNDRVLQFTSISFDVAAEELFPSWLCGSTVVIRPDWVLSFSNFHQFLESEKITVLNLPTAYWHQWVSELSNSNIALPPKLRLVIVGTEQVQPEKLALWQQQVGTKVRWLNAYGPTEATIGITIYEPVDIQENLQIASVPIGRPIANTQIYILDSHLQPVPVGVPGELYIGGDGLARGYLNRPQLTSEKFIQSPFDSSKRLYKTGDLARYLGDGNIEFLGRIDNQVKIRGFRIELGEIEAVLTTHPQVNQAAVIAQEENTGNKRLVAYLVSDKTITTQQLREYLKAQLPDYMVPSVFVTLDTLPLTPNGKIDRKALPAVDRETSRENEYVAPRTQSEQIIANIFNQVLNVENIGINENFFELGGHSLLATQLISRIRSVFSIEIPLRALFSSPTVAQLDQTISQLRNTNNGLTLAPIQPRGETEKIPLSWAQERLWFLNQLEGESATYNIPVAVRVSGNLDINALQQAFAQIVQRHEVLRTNFQTENGTPIQVIEKEATININLVDLQQVETTQRENLVIEQAQLEATTPFDLENASLIRCSLLQLSPSEYVLLLTMHHIISDAWSIGVLIQELSSLYQAFIQGEDISSPDAGLTPLEQLPIQYGDFAVWQRQYLTGELLSTQLDYWKLELSGAPDLLQLSTDFPRPIVQTYQGRTQSFSLNTDLTTKLQTLSRESGTTLFMTLYGAFSTLLYRYSGQSDILIGSPIANRNRSEIEGLIGFFVNTLVLRTRFEDNPSFKELLAQIRETTLKAYEHQDVPFEQVVEALQPQRSLSHSPLFQVMFVLQNAPMADVELPGVTLSSIQLESTIAKFDLTLSITETDQGLVGEWDYNTDLFESETIERMVAHFQNLLQAIVENPLKNVDSLPLLSESERHQLLVEWNDTATDYPKDKCIHQLFEEQVEKIPDALAVVFESESLTYKQLNRRANQLAHHLQSLGVKPEVLVGICVERSVEMVVGLLGILKAGGAYVPLDPNYPQERLSYMLEDSTVEVLVTQSSLLESLPKHNAGVVCLDTDWGLIEQQSQENLEAGVTSDNLAYVIYTSGSTGKPKGVTIEHHSVCNLAQAQTNVFDVIVNSNILQFASFSFDASVWELLMAFTRGATLILGTASQLMPGDNLKQILHDYSITHVTLPPSALAVLPTEGLPQLANIIVAGEACSLELANKWSVGRNFFNAYGPTESTVCATATQIKSGIEKTSIGRPIANTQIYILDKHLQSVPVGVPGELYIGGDGLARGYLNRPQLTSEKFIQSPFDSSKRLYKTGDLARYLGDGNIEFLGRIDNQVKIRGFRIELGEIEAVLATHPQVNQAVIIAQEENTSNKRLVAYLVSDKTITTQQLHEYLKAQLPDYMVPSVFVTLDTLPLTPNGKIDRKALPEPDSIERDTEYLAPRTQSEQIIANIFAQVLNVENVGINENFFELGGHSLLAVRLMSEIQKQFQKNLPLAILFQSPTVEQLAIALGSNVSPQIWSPLVPIQSNGSLPPLFCVPGAGGNVLYFHHLGRYLGNNQPLYGLQPQGLDGETLPLTSIEEIATQYIQAIQTIQPTGPYFLAGHSFGGKVVFEMANQLQSMGEFVAYVGILDTLAPIKTVNHQHDFSNWDDAKWISQIAEVIEEIAVKNLVLDYQTLASLSAEQQINYFKEQLEMVGILPPQTDIKLVRGLVQVYRTQCQINYEPQNTYSAPITLFRATEVDSEQQNYSHLLQEPTWGWKQFSDPEVEIHTVPGNHISMIGEPHVKVLAEKMQQSLEQVQKTKH